VITLLDDAGLHDRIARHGYQFIEQNYSVPTVQRLLDSAVQRLNDLPPRDLPLRRRLLLGMQGWYSHHIAWRIGA
jgi:hypothetical protein